MKDRGRIITRVAVAGSAAALLAPASAFAAAIRTNHRCYLEGEPIGVLGGGFAPGASVSLQARALFGTTVTDPSGAFLANVSAPPLPFTGPGSRRFTLTASDGATSASTTFRVTTFSAKTTPRTKRPQQVVTYHVSGFRPHHRVYAHFLRKGKQRAVRRLGRAKGACGTVRHKMRALPVAHPAYGTWHVQIDQHKRYRKRTRPRLRARLTVYRTFHRVG